MSNTESMAELPPADAADRADQLREAADGSASLVRGLFFTFLLLGTYVAVTIGSTTDEQLLRISPVTLPILDVDLPIVAFYVLIPWLLLLFHFNLLLQLYLLARQLHMFNAAVGQIGDAGQQQAQRARLFPFPFVHLLAGPRDSGITRTLLSLMCWTTIVWVPLGLIVAAQVRFLPYHEPFLTGLQRIAVALDVFLLWLFWPMLMTPGKGPTARWWHTLARTPARLVSRVRTAFDTERAPSERVTRARGALPMILTSIIALGFSFVVAAVPGEPNEGWVAAVLPAPEREEDAAPRPEGNLLTYWVFDRPGAPLHRNLNLADHVLLAQPAGPELLRDLIALDDDQRARALAKISGIVLAGRDLRFANLYRVIMPRADLRGANLDGADIRRADLTEADLRPQEILTAGGCLDPDQHRTLDKRGIGTSGQQYAANAPQVCLTSIRGGALFQDTELPRARLNLALLQNADFLDATMNGASLAGANLFEARLARAQMSSADLNRADLTRADLSGAKLVSADMTRVMLAGARFAKTDLSQATVSAPDWSGVVFEEPVLDGAAVRGTFRGGKLALRGAVVRQANFAQMMQGNLRGADFSKGAFLGAYFGSSDLRGANLSQSDLRGADFTNADLSAADLRGAHLDYARLHRTAVCGADLTGASLNGAVISQSVLAGSTLNGADLDLATFSNVDARAVDWRNARMGDFLQIYRLQMDFGDVRSSRSASTKDRLATITEIADAFRGDSRNLTGHIRKVLDAAGNDRLADLIRGGTGYVSAKYGALCDESVTIVDTSKPRTCVLVEHLPVYVSVLLNAACSDPHILAGMVNRLEMPRPPQVNRGGSVIGIPAVEDYQRALAEALTVRDCPTLATLTEDQRQPLIAILERSSIEIPDILTQDAPTPEAAVEAAKCKVPWRP